MGKKKQDSDARRDDVEEPRGQKDGSSSKDGQNRFLSPAGTDENGAEWVSSSLNDLQIQLNRLIEQSTVDGDQTQAPQDLQVKIETIGRILQSQQLKTEQSTQKLLSQGSTSLGAGERMQSLLKTARDLRNFLQREGEEGIKSRQKECTQMLTTLTSMLHQERMTADDSYQQAMQQALVALASAQEAVITGKTYDQIGSLLEQCKNRIQQIQNPYQPLGQS